jgi:hypothetical protein
MAVDRLSLPQLQQLIHELAMDSEPVASRAERASG